MSNNRICSNSITSFESDGTVFRCTGGAYDTDWFTFPHCAGEITVIDTDRQQCSVAWTMITVGSDGVSSPSQPFDPTQLDPGLIAAHIGVGFFILLPVWAAAMGAKHLLSFISFKR